jgi:hypothetical protein
VVAAVGTSTVGEEDEAPSAIHPVAAVIRTLHPVTYMPNNTSNMMYVGSDSNVSSLPVSAAVASPTLHEDKGDLAPLHIPHLWWEVEVMSNVEEFPVHVQALLDDGSHTVIIREDVVDYLALAHLKLCKPEHFELAMTPNRDKRIIKLSKFVKLYLHDPVSRWAAKPVCAIVTPSLCTPILLGLPFLSHNNVVVDHTTWTVIEKNTGVDLLNLEPPKRICEKKSLKVLYKEVVGARKAVLLELKVACWEQLQKVKGKLKLVKGTNCVAAIRQCIEVLSAQEKLKGMSDRIKEEFWDVFSLIPHVRKLPDDVYC